MPSPRKDKQTTRRDSVNPAAFGRFAGLWLILHGHGAFYIVPGKSLFFLGFSLIPWVGVMAVGYALGAPLRRRHWRKLVPAGGIFTRGAIHAIPKRT